MWQKHHYGDERHHQRRNDLFHHLLSNIRSAGIQHAGRRSRDIVDELLRQDARKAVQNDGQVHPALLLDGTGRLFDEARFEKFSNTVGESLPDTTQASAKDARLPTRSIKPATKPLRA